MEEPLKAETAIVESLLTMIIDKAGLLNKYGEPLDVTPKMMSTLMNEKANVHRKIQNAAKNTEIKVCTLTHFEKRIVPYMDKEMTEYLIYQLLDLIRMDTNHPPIPVTIKTRFFTLANRENLAEFLTSLFLYAITRNNKISRTNENSIQIAPMTREQNSINRKTIAFCTDSNIELGTLPEKYYIDRNSLHEEIHLRFTNNKNPVFMQTIIGLGGVGKSTLAVKYAKEYENEYSLIRIICAETKESLERCVTTFLDRKIGVYYRENVRVVQEEFRNWFDNVFEGEKDWLLIFDNVENFDLLKPYLPTSSRGRFLFTSRNQCLPSWMTGKTLEIGCFSPEDAQEFLLKRTGIKDVENAELLAKRLGYLPLALVQASAYITMSPKIDFSEYLSHLDESGIMMFSPEDPDNPEMLRSAVYTTWNISMKEIKLKSAKQFLEVVSFLPSNNTILKHLPPIPVEYDEVGDVIKKETKVISFLSHVEIEPLRSHLNKPTMRKKIIGELVRFSLIKYDEATEGINIHRLLQEVIREKINLNEDMFSTVLNLLPGAVHDEIFEHESSSFDLGYISVDEHLRTIEKYIIELPESNGLHFNKIIDYKKNLAMQYLMPIDSSKKNYGYAVDIYKQIIDMCEQMESLGQGAVPKIINAHQGIASIHRMQNEYDEALAYAHKALLHINEKSDVLGQEFYVETLQTYDLIILILMNQGEFAEAVEYVDKALHFWDSEEQELEKLRAMYGLIGCDRRNFLTLRKIIIKKWKSAKKEF